MAIECYSLNLAHIELFNNRPIGDITTDLYETYVGMVSENLLRLAVSIRTACCDQPWYSQKSERFNIAISKMPKDDGSIELISDGESIKSVDGKYFSENKSASIKDVCDKIIHATDIKREMLPKMRNVQITLYGSSKGIEWSLELDPCEFSIGFLSLLDKSA